MIQKQEKEIKGSCKEVHGKCKEKYTPSPLPCN
jgi:hypothetical protein